MNAPPIYIELSEVEFRGLASRVFPMIQASFRGWVSSSAIRATFQNKSGFKETRYLLPVPPSVAEFFQDFTPNDPIEADFVRHVRT